MTDFRSLGVSPAVCELLAARGIAAPFQIQSLVIPEALRGGDVLAKSPTGSGKTLAFAIPIAQLVEPGAEKPFALVLVPTRELCAQVTEEFALIAGDKVKVASVYGGVPLKAQADEAKRAHVIVATPGRLQDLVDRGLVSLDHVRDPRARRGRPHARHGVQAAGRQARAPAARRPPDDVLLGDARRRGRRARPSLHALPCALRGRASGRPPLRRRRPPIRRRSHRTTRSRRSSSC